MKSRIFLPALLAVAGCAGPAPYVYRYVPGRTAELRDGCAIAPPEAPDAVQAAIAAGNRIAGLPYVWGGGHGRSIDSGYDCSGSASYVLQATGRLDGSMPSVAFRRYGESGEGKWISLYARRDHVFLVVAGLRFDTGWGDGPRGPHWTTRGRPTNGSVVRHPPGL